MKDAAATGNSAPPGHSCVCDCRQCEINGSGMFGPQPDGSPGVRVVPGPKRLRKQLRRQMLHAFLSAAASRRADAGAVDAEFNSSAREVFT